MKGSNIKSPSFVKPSIILEIRSSGNWAGCGIRSLDDARQLLHSGADKVSLNSPAIENPALLGQLAAEFGSQCVVVGIDSRAENGDYFVKQFTGDPTKTRGTRWRTVDWAREAQSSVPARWCSTA